MISINNYEFYPKLICRTPAFSYLAYITPIQEAIEADYFKAAIFLASKSLFGALEKKSFNFEYLSEKEKLAVQMYLNRMCFRPTPFGLFSGFSTVSWLFEKETETVNKYFKIHVQLDSLFLAWSLDKKSISSNIKFTLNNSLYKVGNDYRYIRYRESNAGEKRNFYIESFHSTEITKSVISFFAKRRTKCQLINFLVQKIEPDDHECEAFVEELIASQVIIPETLENITGQDYFYRLLKVVDRESQKFKKLSEFEKILDEIKVQNAVELPGRILMAANKLEEISGQKWHSSFFYVNTENTDVQPHLPEDTRIKILSGLSCIEKLLPLRSKDPMDDFVQAFRNKFDMRWMPLMVALDPEAGVGYEPFARGKESQSPLLKNMTLRHNFNSDGAVEWSAAHSLLLDKWHASDISKQGVKTIFLEDSDLASLSDQNPHPPVNPNTSVIFRIAGDAIFLEQAGGATAIALLGRFTPFISDLKKQVCEIARLEERANPDVVFAEIAHVSDLALMNIEKRETIRQYEIPVLTFSSLPDENQIPLNDLLVSVQEDEVILWSVKLRKRVIPRLSSAFNYIRSELPVFRFLCDLQSHRVRANFTFDLTTCFPNLSFYPRVQYKSTILSLASWHLNENQIKILCESEKSSGYLPIMNFANKMKWPRYISVSKSDHYIVIDSHKEEDLVFLLRILKKERSAIIKEFPFFEERDRRSTESLHPPYIQQFIAQLYHTKKIYGPVPNFPMYVKFPVIQRKFIPGSKWYYFKIYCHPSRSDELLREYITPFCDQCVAKELAYQWFFIRYFDSSYHIRVRIRILSPSFGAITNRLAKKLRPLISSGLISDFALATYEREIERYDPQVIEKIESCFCESSQLITAFFQDNWLQLDEDIVWIEMAFYSIDILLESFAFSEERKIDLFATLFQNLKREFKSDDLLIQLQKKYREIRQITRLLKPSHFNHKPGVKQSILKFKSGHLDLAEATNEWSENKQTKLIADLIHMHLNRLYAETQRDNELVIYYCLLKHYQSGQGRKKKNLVNSFAAY